MKREETKEEALFHSRQLKTGATYSLQLWEISEIGGVRIPLERSCYIVFCHKLTCEDH